MERPLADDVARPARSYLAALLPADEVSDAWHELLDDAAYWGERDLRPVLRLAHQVVLQHERVTPEVAALVLAELGVDDPVAVAHVLDTDEVTAGQWTAQAEASREGDVAPPAAAPVGRFADPARAPSSAEGPLVPPADVSAPPEREARPSAPARVPAARADDATTHEATADAATTDGATAAPADAGAVRIGFDDDHPLPYADGTGDADVDRPRVTTRGIVAIALLLWVVVMVLWAVAR